MLIDNNIIIGPNGGILKWYNTSHNGHIDEVLQWPYNRDFSIMKGEFEGGGFSLHMMYGLETISYEIAMKKFGIFSNVYFHTDRIDSGVTYTGGSNANNDYFPYANGATT